MIGYALFRHEPAFVFMFGNLFVQTDYETTASRWNISHEMPSNPSLIESRTLRLEPLAAAHAEEMFEPMSAIAIYDYMPGRPPASVSALRERYIQLERGRSSDGKQEWLNWIVRLHSGQCAGFVQATIYPTQSADFAFAFAPSHWGRSVAFEACRAALPWLAAERGLAALFATVDPRNSRSVGLLLRLGFSEVTPADYPHGEVEVNDRVFAMST